MTKVTIRPRLEVVAFSLYWREPLYVDTKCLDDVSLDLPDGGLSGQELLIQVAQTLGWPATSELQRLDGFDQPWERLIHKGRELALDQAVNVPTDPGVVLVVVRRVLKADGWRISQAEDFLSSDDEDDTK